MKATEPLPVNKITHSFSNGRTYGVLLGVLVAYCLLIHWCYREITSDNYAYLGFTYTEPSWFQLACRGLLAILPGLFLPLGLRRPSAVTSWLLYLQVYVPTVLLTLFLMPLRILETTALSLCMCLSFIFLGWSIQLPLKTWKRNTTDESTYWIFAYCIFGMFVLLIGLAFGFNFTLPSLDDIYERRSDYGDQLSAMGRAMAYVLEAQSGAIGPLIIAYGLVKKRMLPIVAGVMGQVMVTAITGYKSAIIAPVFIAGIYFILRTNARQGGLILAVGGMLMLGLGVVERVFDRDPLYFGYLPQRVIITPGSLTAHYFDFFLDNPLLMMRQTQLSRFLGSAPYDLPVSYIISEVYLNAPGGNANVNLWGDGFANFGYVGIFLVTLGLAFLLHVIDRLAQGRDPLIVCLMLVMPSMVLSNASLQTTMVSHGLGLLVMFFYLMPAKVEAASKVETERLVKHSLKKTYAALEPAR